MEETLENPNLDLTGTDLIEYFLSNGHFFQVKLPEHTLEALKAPGVSEAIVSFHTREVLDYAKKEGKLMTWLYHWVNKWRAKQPHSIETFCQALPFVEPLLEFWLTKYGSINPHVAFYIPELTKKLEACIDWHRDTKEFFARICITLCGKTAKKKTLFRAKKYKQKRKTGAQIILESPHGSVIIFDQHSSGFNSNIYHNTSVKDGHAMTIVIDLFLYKSRKDTKLEDVVSEMINEGIFEAMEIKYTVP